MDPQVGAALFVIGFAVQLAAALGWHEASWLAVGIALGVAAVVAVAAWQLLRRFWRPRMIRAVLFVLLRSLSVGDWWPVLLAFGHVLKRPRHSEDELIADYAVRLIGENRWRRLTTGVDQLQKFAKPRGLASGAY